MGRRGKQPDGPEDNRQKLQSLPEGCDGPIEQAEPPSALGADDIDRRLGYRLADTDTEIGGELSVHPVWTQGLRGHPLQTTCGLR